VPRVREPPTGHQTVEMRVQQQRLTPGMQRRDDARTGAQIFLVTAPLVKRLVHRGKQQLRHRGDVGQPEVI
jgi:hypothetical protein